MFDRAWVEKLETLAILARQKPQPDDWWLNFKAFLESKVFIANLEKYGMTPLLDLILSLPLEQKQPSLNFLEKIGAGRFIKNAEEMAKYIMLLPEDQAIFFYEQFKPYLVKSEKHYALFLDCLPKDSHLVLWNHLIPHTGELCLALKSFKVPSSRYVFLHNLDKSFLKTRIKNGDDIAKILCCLPGLYREDFLKELGHEFLVERIQDGHQLTNILKMLIMPVQRLIFLRELGELDLNRIIQDEAQLFAVAGQLPAESLAQFLQKASQGMAAGFEGRASPSGMGLFDSSEESEDDKTSDSSEELRKRRL